MAFDFAKAGRDAKILNQILKSIAENANAWKSFSSNLQDAASKYIETQTESIDKTNELAAARDKILKSLGEEEKKTKDINKVMDEVGKKYKGVIVGLERWKAKLEDIEKTSASIWTKMGAHIKVVLAKDLIKLTKGFNNLFSLKGALKLLKTGIGFATGIFAGLVMTVKAVSGLVVKVLGGAFKLVSGIVKTSAGLVLSFFGKIWDTITSGGGEIKVAIAEMAQALGFFNGELYKSFTFLRGNIRDWYKMGLSVGEAAKYVIELSKAYGKFMGFSRDTNRMYLEHIKMSRALGLGAEEAAKLARVLDLMGTNMKGLTFALVGTFGRGGPLESMGVMIPEIARDLAESGDQLALMGEKGRKTFVAGAVWVRQYHMSIKDLIGMMDKFDTLSSAAENVSKLNQMFGTTINAMEMLTETDPAARLEKVRKELLATGKNWENMDYFQRKSLTTMMGIGAEQGEILFSSRQIGRSRADIARAMEQEEQNQKNSEKRRDEVNRAILEQLRASRGVIGSLMPLFYRVWMAFGRMFGPFLFNLRRGVLNFAEQWANAIYKLAENKDWRRMTKIFSRQWRTMMTDLGTSWGNMWRKIDMKKFGEDFYGTINAAIDALKNILKDLFPNWAHSAEAGAMKINDIIHGIAMRLQGIIKWVGEHGAGIIRTIGKVASSAFSVVKKVFEFFDNSNWTAAAGIIKDLFKVVAQDAAKIVGLGGGLFGGMTEGIDPAMVAAKFLQTTYMKIRDIVGQIVDWWKEHGDSIKETMRNVMTYVIRAGEITGRVFTEVMGFLTKHPAILTVLLAGKAVGGMASMLGLGGGPAILGAAGRGGMWGGRAGRFGQFESAGQGLTTGQRIVGGAARGAIGGTIGAGIGGLIGGATGATVGGGIGTGIGIGSMFGPGGAALGAILGASAGIIFKSITDRQKEAEAEQERLASMSREIDQRWLDAKQKEIDLLINTNRWRRTEIVDMQEMSSRLNESSNRLVNQRSITEQQMDLDQQILRNNGQGREARIREKLLKALRDSQVFQDMQNQLNEQKAAQAIDETQLEVTRSTQQQHIALIDKQIEEAKARALQTANLGQFEQWAQSLPQAFTVSDIDAYQDAIRGKLDELVNQKLITPDVRDRMTEKLRGQWANVLSTLEAQVRAGHPDREPGNTSPEYRRRYEAEIQAEINSRLPAQREQLLATMTTMGADIEKAIGLGNFPAIADLQQKRLAAVRTITSNEMRVNMSRLRLQQMELLSAKLQADVLAKRITPEVAQGTIQGFNFVNESLAGLESFGSRRAFGGLVTSPTRAILGENAEPELVVPLRGGPVNGSPGTTAILNDYMERLGGGSRGRNEERVIVVPFNVDGRKLSEAMIRITNRALV